MFIFVIMFLILMLYGSKYIRQAYIEEPLNCNNTFALRGLCAIEIVIGHIGVVTESPWLFINRKAGILIVGLFFFLSGYGLMYSKMKKKDYMENFLRVRIPKILLPVIPVYILYYIILYYRDFRYKQVCSARRHITIPVFMESSGENQLVCN